MKAQLHHITSISLNRLINKRPIMWQLAENKHQAHLSAWSIANSSTCVLCRLFETRKCFSGHTLSHAVASFVYYATYCNTPGNNEIRVTDRLAPAVHRPSAQHQSDNRQAALADFKNPIRHETRNPAEGAFCRIVEIPLDLDTRSDIHPSLQIIKSDS